MKSHGIEKGFVMSDKFEEWWKKERHNMGVNWKYEFRCCWDAAIKSTNPNKEKTVWCEFYKTYECVFDTKNPYTCEYAAYLLNKCSGKSKIDCSHWKQIEVNMNMKNESKCNSCGNAPAKKLHPCPFKVEVNDDDETLCDCCDDCMDECAGDI